MLDHGAGGRVPQAPPPAQARVASELRRDAADGDERADLRGAGRRQPVQRLADLPPVAPHHRGQRGAVEETVSAAQGRLPEGGGRGPQGRPVLEGQEVKGQTCPLQKIIFSS